VAEEESSQQMTDRPFSVTAISGLFLAVGIAGIVRVFQIRAWHHFSSEDAAALALNAVAIFCGVVLLQRRNWARWLALAWIAAHIAIGFLNSLQQVAIHALFLVLIGYLLFRRDANVWFRGAISESAPTQ